MRTAASPGPAAARPAAGRLRTMTRRTLGLVWAGPAEEDLRAAVTGRTVLITGGSSGIGAATAERLGAAGARVIIVARRAAELEEVRGRIAAAGGTAWAYPVDLADPDAVSALVTTVLADHGHVDVLVNNAGKSIRRAVEHSYDRHHDFTRTIDVNYLGPVRLALGLLPSMRARGRGHLVYVSTIGVDMPAPLWSAYAASKAAFEMWLRCVAPEVRTDGVASTSIHFPLVHTAMSAPTESLRGKPGMTPQEAADAVCRAVVDRPRLMRPWWAGLYAVGNQAAHAPADLVLTRHYARERARTRRRAAGTGGDGHRREH